MVFGLVHATLLVTVLVGRSVRLSVRPSITLGFFLEKTDELTAMVTYRVACTRLMAIGLVLYQN